MKKIIITLMAIASLTFISCANDDGTKADLRWKNKTSATTVEDIKWVSSEGKTDQVWNDSYNSGTTTNYKGINALAGTGECISGGNPATIEFDTTDYEGTISVTTNSATIQENAAATLSIANTAKK